jgi:ubiquinone/menaquinone biosynthesis C-methylase UbiE
MSSSARQRFSETAAAYAATMAPSLRPIAETVVRRAALCANERVLDIGTGTGIAAAAARGDGREITGIDAAPGMLAIARREVEGVVFAEMDFGALRFDDAAFHAVIAAHSLLFATDQVAVLGEWRRVTRPRGRLSLSVPGPREVTPTAIYGEIYQRYGVGTSADYPAPAALVERARAAGWSSVKADADPSTAILLADEAAFRRWREIGMRGPGSADFTAEQHRALTDEMLAATPRTSDGTLRIPFGTIYLTASR